MDWVGASLDTMCNILVSHAISTSVYIDLKHLQVD